MAVVPTAADSAIVANGNWSELPEDIAVLIINHLDKEIANLVYFGAVCSWWHSVMQNYIRMYKPKNQFPWRLLQQNKDMVLRSTIRFYSFTNQKKYSVHIPCHIPRLIVGYSKGFIAFVPRRGKKVLHIYNPITKAPFTFPEIQNYMLPLNKFIVNTVDNNNNNNSECMHVAFLTSCFNGDGAQLISIAKVGDVKWSYFSLEKYKKIDANRIDIDDIIFHKNRLYLITKEAEYTLVFDLSSSSSSFHDNLDQLHPIADLDIFHKVEQVWWSKFVESDKKELFLIIAYLDYSKIGFVHQLFRFDGCRDKWNVIDSVFTQFSIYRRDRGLYSLYRWEALPLIVQHQFYGDSCDRSVDKFIAIHSTNEANVELKIYNCDDDMRNSWFLPSP